MTTRQSDRTELHAPGAAAIRPKVVTRLAALCGLVSAVATLGAAGVVALILGVPSPLYPVGQLFIDLVPPGVKTFVIAVFGTGDKVFLFVVLGVLVLIAAVFVGILQYRRAPLGVVLLCAVGVLSLIAAVSRANAGLLSALPTLAGVGIGVLVLEALMRRLDRWVTASHRPIPRSGSRPGGVERRDFLQFAAFTGGAAAIAGIGSQAVTAGAATRAATVTKVTLPAPASTVGPVPAGAEFDLTGLSPWLTPRADFYRIDTALQVPIIDPAQWKLHIHGMVENEIDVTFAELLARPLEEKYVTLACVSQEVGGDLIGNAKWLGYPIRNLLARAKPTAGADMVLSTSEDGFTAGTPLGSLQDPDVDAILAVGMNGKPLPVEHGFPVRMVVPGLYGYVSATKWVVDLKVTTFADDEGYWTPRGWSAKGPIKLSSRIDVPRGGSSVSAGRVTVAGVAWHQHVGISRVQVQIDRGPWQDAELARVVTTDAWVQWRFSWDASAGSHTIAVRAIDASGDVQTAALADPAPNGSTGHHTIQVNVG